MNNTETETTDLKTKLISEFLNFEKSLNGESETNLHFIRKDAFEKFSELGFPVKKLEDWKYTNLNPALKQNFIQSFSEYTSALNKEDIEKYLIKDSGINLLVFVNGHYDKELSHIETKNENVFMGSFSEGMKDHKELIEKHFAKIAAYDRNGFVAVNTAFAKDGCFFYVKKNYEVKEPVHILNISDARNESFFSQLRKLVIVEEGGSINIATDYHTTGNQKCFTNAVTEIFCGKNSKVEHYKIQNDGDNSYHVGTTQVHQEKDSRFSDTTISWGGAITRNDLNSVFDGTNTECHFYGLYLLTGKQHVDNHTLADHKMPNCYSNELYKGIIDDNATGVFNGKIMVREDAQKTNAYQSNNNILLSDDATIYSKPQLEIFADDVKCSHGATTGQLNEDEMFYLQARGIGKENARTLLLYAYASDVIDSIKIDELREMIVMKLERMLKKGD